MHTNLRTLDLNLLRVFDAVYRHQSVTQAASELALSHSAISHALGRLRRYCDDELFFRVGHQMQPTLFASDLAATVHDSLHRLNLGVQKRPRFDAATSQHCFTFAVTDFTAFSLFPRLMNHLQQVAPGLRFQLVHSQQKVVLHELMSGRVDFALGFSENHDRQWPDIDVLDWLEDEYVTIASAAFFPADRPLTQQQYIAARHVVITPWNEASGYIDTELAALGLQRDVAVRMPSMLGAPFIIAQSSLLMTLPRHAAQTLKASAAFEIHPLPFAIPPFQVKIYSWQKNSQREACRWLLNQLQTLKMT